MSRLDASRLPTLATSFAITVPIRPIQSLRPIRYIIRGAFPQRVPSSRPWYHPTLTLSGCHKPLGSPDRTAHLTPRKPTIAQYTDTLAHYNPARHQSTKEAIFLKQPVYAESPERSKGWEIRSAVISEYFEDNGGSIISMGRRRRRE